MNVKRQKSEIIGALGTTIFHIFVLICLLYFGFSRQIPEEEEGIEVMFGNINDAAGTFQPQNTGTSPTVAQTPPPPPPTVKADPVPVKEDLLTQEEEESINLANKAKEEKKKKEEQKKKEQEKATKEKAAEKTRKKAEEDAKAKAKAEADALAKAKADEAARLAAEKASIEKRTSGVFGSGTSKEGSRGNTKGSGTQGSPFGTSEKGATQGSSGWGSFSLNGRSLGGEGLHRPAYQVQEEGTIVINITVDPAGNVIGTGIGRGTDIENKTMRDACINAAKKTKFNNIEGSNNQSGFITYKFSLK